jgi:antitoxin CptB
MLYRATHRGTYENDILLGGFVRRHVDALPESELEALEALLELPDNDLADWLTGRMPIPAEADSPMLRRVRREAGQDETASPSPCGRGLGGGGAGAGTAPSPQPPPPRGGGGRS